MDMNREYREARRKADEANARLDFVLRFMFLPFMACLAIYAFIQALRV